MRRCFHSATGQDIINTYQHYTPIEDAIADTFEDGTGPGPNDDTAYTLHFGTNYRRSRWNKAVIDNILQRVPIERSELHYQICDLDVDVQCAMLWDYIGQAQKFERRKKDVDLLLAAPTLNGLERSNLQRTKEVLHVLGAEGQSSEESGPEDALLVTVPHYRQWIKTPMMVDLDQRAKEMSKNQSRLLGKKALPRPKHVRVRSEQRSIRTVKKGLPRSLHQQNSTENITPL
ncbi:hypothetical protein C8R42DRAFT_646347 [Lentinula raphanica]|nr:hypothetical protein C8R42DRAFT_646347 [Lentinula raphanica]